MEKLFPEYANMTDAGKLQCLEQVLLAVLKKLGLLPAE